MADSKITALTSIGTITDPAVDPLVVVDVSDTSMAATGTTKKVTLNQLLATSPTATLASATITGALTVQGTGPHRFGTTNYSQFDQSSLQFVGSRATPGALSIYGNANRLIFQADTGGYLFQNGANTLTLFSITNDATQVTLNSTGLGVGVSPSYKLDVLGSGTISGRFKTAGAINALYLEDSGTTAGSLYIGTSGDTFRIITGSNVRVNVDSTGNVGISVTPSAWNYGKVIEFGGGSIFTDSGNNECSIVQGAYNNAGWKYKYTGLAVGLASNYLGTHVWYNAPSGTAGNAITFTQSMTLDSSGNLLVGTTSTGGSASNSVKNVGGVFSTVNGATGSIATGVAATLFTAPSESVFMVSAYIVGSSAPANYNAIAIVKVSGGIAAITTISSALNLTISLSGLNVQATQTSGVNQSFAYSAIRIS
jgi:hypothetical protein